MPESRRPPIFSQVKGTGFVGFRHPSSVKIDCLCPFHEFFGVFRVDEITGEPDPKLPPAIFVGSFFSGVRLPPDEASVNV